MLLFCFLIFDPTDTLLGRVTGRPTVLSKA